MATKKAALFTAAEKDFLGGAAYGVWQECAYDLLQSVAEESGGRKSTVSRAVAIEIALDADRMTSDLRRSLKSGHNPDVLTADLIARVEAADYKTLIAAVRGAFTYARYGM